MIAKVSISFITDNSDAELLVESARIISSLTGNTHYPMPDPTLAVVGAARTAFMEAVNKLDGSTAPVVIRDEKRTDLENLLRQLSVYVQGACKGDLVILLTSGFLAQKERQPVGQLPPPQNLRLTRTDMSGELKARCAPGSHASSYQWRRATSTDPTMWTELAPTTAANTILGDLIPGTIYVVQVRSIGSAGPSDWSDPAMLMAV